MKGTTQCIPLEVTWDDGDSFWVDLWVTDFGDEVLVMATCPDVMMYASEDLTKRDEVFSKRFMVMVRSVIEEVALSRGRRWGTNKYTVARRKP